MLLILMLASADLPAAEPATADALHMPTMGGKQFWADELFFHQWHIQRNVLTGHCRLLDKNHLRHASGTFDRCRATLDRIKRKRNLPPMQGKAVILLHGLFRSRDSMKKLADHLKEQGGYTVFRVAYPSTQRDVGSHARSVGRIIENLDRIEEINFVAHSMGNIVVRHYLSDQARMKLPSGKPRPRIGRFVMLAPPNHGSAVALTLAKNGVFKALAGKSGQQLGADWARLEEKLVAPACQFGIIAGGKGDEKGFNPLLDGDDDGTISLAGTRLAGAHDFIVVGVLHSFIMNDAKVHQYTLRFLQKGHFLSAEDRRPIQENDH